MLPSLISRTSVCFTLLALIVTAPPASAQTDYYWNAPTGGDGTWDTTLQNWSTTTGGPVDYIWLNSGSERANFGNTAGTVTLGTGISAYGLNFTTSGYTITGNTLTLAGTGGVVDTGAGNATINSTLAGTVGLTKNGAGVLTLGTASTYTGTTTVSAGTLQAGAANVFSSGAFSLANVAGVILDLNNTNQTIGSLAGGGATGGNVSLGTGTLTVGGNNASTTFSGLFTGSGTVTKVGSGTLTLRGNSTWTGPLNVFGGVVSIDALGRLNSAASATGTVTLNGGTLQHTGTGSTGSTLLAPTRGIAIGANGGTIDITTTTGGIGIYRGTITGLGNTLTKIGAGEFRVDTAAANNTFSRLVVNQGLFRVGGTGPETGFGAVPASPMADAITLNGGAIGTSVGITLNANRGITLGAGGGTVNVTAAALTIPSIITGSGGLSVLGDAETDVLTLSGANNYTGATSITLSRLTANATNTLPATTAVTVNSGATFNLAGFNQTIGSLAGAGNVSLGTGTLTTGGNNTSTTYSGVLSGFSGSLVKQGTGTMSLTGLNTFGGGGGVTINGGTLLANGQSGTDSGTGAGPVAVNNTGTLGGNGRAAGAVTVNGGGRVLAGTGTAAGQTLSLGSNLTVANTGGIKTVVGNSGAFNDTNTTGSSLVAVTGTFNRDATTSLINIDLMSDGSTFAQDTTYTRRVLTYGTLGSNLTAQSYTSGDNVFALNAFGFTISSGWQVLVGDGGNWVDVQFTPVPEPATVMGVAAAGLGLVGLVRRRLRRREVAIAA